MTEGTCFLLLLEILLNAALAATKVSITDQTTLPTLPDWYPYWLRISPTPYDPYGWIQHNKARSTFNYDRYTTTPTPVYYSAQPNSFKSFVVIVSCVYFIALTCFCLCCCCCCSFCKYRKQARKESSAVTTVAPTQQAPRQYVSECETWPPYRESIAITTAVTQQATRPYLTEWETSSPESSDDTRAVTSAARTQQPLPYLFELETSNSIAAVTGEAVPTQHLRPYLFELETSPPYREPSTVTTAAREAVPAPQSLLPGVTEWETPPPSYFDVVASCMQL